MLAPLQYQYPSPFAISAPQREQRSVCRLRDLRIQKDYAAAFREAEKALQRFPNNFQVVYECARIYQLSGL